MLPAIREIFRENGLPGFFSGLVPRVLGEIASLIMASFLTYTINKYVIEDRELRMYSATSMTVSIYANMYHFVNLYYVLHKIRENKVKTFTKN